MFIPFKPTICRSFCKRFSLWFFQTFFGMFTPGPTSFNLGTKLYLILYILSNEKTSQYIIIPLYPVIIPLYPIISHYIPLYPIISHYIPLYPSIIPLYPIISHYWYWGLWRKSIDNPIHKPWATQSSRHMPWPPLHHTERSARQHSPCGLRRTGRFNMV